MCSTGIPFFLCFIWVQFYYSFGIGNVGLVFSTIRDYALYRIQMKPVGSTVHSCITKSYLYFKRLQAKT